MRSTASRYAFCIRMIDVDSPFARWTLSHSKARQITLNSKTKIGVLLNDFAEKSFRDSFKWISRLEAISIGRPPDDGCFFSHHAADRFCVLPDRSAASAAGR